MFEIINQYAEDLAKIAEKALTNPAGTEEKSPSFIVKKFTDKCKMGMGQINLIIFVNGKALVYSIYVNSLRDGIISIMICNNSSRNHRPIFINSSDDSINKSLDYIPTLITNGISRANRKPRYHQDNDDKTNE